MAANEIHLYDSGIDFVVTIRDAEGIVDTSEATVREYRFQKPDGTLITRPASFLTDGADGKLTYSSISTDFDQEGPWRFQVYLEIGPDHKYSDIGRFKVYPNLPLEV